NVKSARSFTLAIHTAPVLSREGLLIFHKKLKDVEISVPIVYGNISFWLVDCIRPWATNEDLGVVIKRAVFQLHSSFNNPTRVIESPPFELSECGWGEFEIAITLFSTVICTQRMSLVLCQLKKPVVVESYDEIVFPEPSEAFLARVQNQPALIVPRLPAGSVLPPPVPVEDPSKRKRGDTKDHPMSQWFMNFSEADELLQLAAARQQVQAHIAKFRREISLLDGQQQQQVNSVSDHEYDYVSQLQMVLQEFWGKSNMAFMCQAKAESQSQKNITPRSIWLCGAPHFG
ncbi:YEATS family protein, partial [Prunus dulcis]